MFLFQLLLIISSISFTFLNDDLHASSTLCMYIYLTIILLEFISNRRITLIFIFLSAFIFIIIPEGILNYEDLYSEWGIQNVNKGFSFCVVTSGLIFIGYKLFERRNRYSIIEGNEITEKKLIINKKGVLTTIILLYNIFFLIINFKNAIYGLIYGRASAFPFLYSSLLYSIGFIVIGITNDLFKNNKIKTLLFNLPIIFVFLSVGTRFFIIYIIFILFFDYFNKLTFKKIILLFFAAILTISTTNSIKDLRRGGLLSTRTSQIEYLEKNSNLTESIAKLGSPEGIIRNSAMITDYSKKKGYTYGRSIGFLGIFWIPRAIWPNKPVMLDSWLIREYYGNQFGEGYSSASGYGGELYMDFGYLFASIILFFFGYFLAKVQLWIDLNHRQSLQYSITSGFLYGWIFFGTRSLLTSTYMLIYFLVSSYLVFNFLIKTKIAKISYKKNINT